MGRSKGLSGEISIIVDGKEIPYLLIDEDDNVTWLVSEEDRKKYEQAILNNMGDSMSLYYTAHPEELQGG